MRILVQKYGGTSVATGESRELVYRKILAAREAGLGLVVVISAMGRIGAPYATDTLLDLIRLESPEAERRELDLIFTCGEVIAGTIVTAALQQRKQGAAYLTGQQAGIVSSGDFGDARILRVDTARIRALLGEGKIVVVAGGQGATGNGELTSLGRGGSDTTACALGVALDAERIDIYTDVEGIFTTDPRLVAEARLIRRISYEDCCLMAYQGAKVMHPRSVEVASQKPEIELRVRSVFSDHPGTLIGGGPAPGAGPMEDGRPVGIALLKEGGLSKISMILSGKGSTKAMQQAFCEAIEATGTAVKASVMQDKVISSWIEGDPGAAVKAVHDLI